MGYGRESSSNYSPGSGLGLGLAWAWAEPSGQTPDDSTKYLSTEERSTTTLLKMVGAAADQLSKGSVILRTRVLGYLVLSSGVGSSPAFQVPIPYTIGTPTKKMCPNSISKYAGVNAGSLCVIVGITSSDITSQIIGPSTDATFSTP